MNAEDVAPATSMGVVAAPTAAAAAAAAIRYQAVEAAPMGSQAAASISIKLLPIVISLNPLKQT